MTEIYCAAEPGARIVEIINSKTGSRTVVNGTHLTEVKQCTSTLTLSFSNGTPKFVIRDLTDQDQNKIISGLGISPDNGFMQIKLSDEIEHLKIDAINYATIRGAALVIDCGPDTVHISGGPQPDIDNTYATIVTNTRISRCASKQ